MFKVVAATVEEYFRADLSRERDLRRTDVLIRAAAPGLSRHFVSGTAGNRPGMSMTMLGYGSFQYTVKASAEPIDWPIVGLALQKNYLSLYVAPRRDGTSFVTPYAGRLGRVRLGGNNLRFTGFADLDPGGLTGLLAAVDTAQREGEQFRYGRTTGG